MLKIRGEIRQKTIKKINQTKNWFFEINWPDKLGKKKSGGGGKK